MKASLAASTQICMDQQRLIQMLQESSVSAAAARATSTMEADDLFALGGVGARVTLPPRPPHASRPASKGHIDAAGGAGGEAKAEAGQARGAGIFGGSGTIRGSDSCSGVEDAAEAFVSGGMGLVAEHGDGTGSVRGGRSGAGATARQAVAREEGGGEGEWRGRGRDGGDVVDAGGVDEAKASTIDDDIISHSSLRRAFDEAFLNQPLRRRDHRRADQKPEYSHHFVSHRGHAGDGRGGGFGSGGSCGMIAGIDVNSALQELDLDLDPGLIGGHIRAR